MEWNGKVWNELILFTLERYGVKGKILHLLTYYLHERYQSEALSEQTSSWEIIKSEVPQRSSLGPILFLIT